ncbi:MAG: lactonase family protein [Bacteroides sp.]
MNNHSFSRMVMGAAVAAGACLGSMGCSSRPQTTSTTIDSEEQLMLVGTYTNAGSEGIYSLRFNQSNAEWQLLDSAQVSNPSFLAIDSRRELIYSVSENGGPKDALVLLSINPTDGAMQQKGSWTTQGAAPCYVSFGPHAAATANYSGGSLSLFPLDEQGVPAPLDTLFLGECTGADPERQEAAHVHCAIFSPDQRYLFATDFSSDRLLRFATNDSAPLLSQPQVAATIEPGSGPRHLTFAPDGRHAYLISELSGMVHSFAYQAETGELTLQQVIETDSVHARGSAHILLSPDGRFLYASNRLEHEGISIFAVNPTNGQLTPAGYQLTGRHPRHFALTPNGHYLLAACRDSNCIEIYLRDTDTGALAPTGKSIPLSKPVFVGWFMQE